VTIEPFPAAGPIDSALDAVVGGREDDRLVALARMVRAAGPQTVLLRWGHEMELANLYPWSDREPATYRAAYRRVVGIFQREGATNVRWVWSPAGNAEAPAYYPGDDVVDLVGITVLGDQGWDRAFGQPPQTFEQLIQAKYPTVAGFGKPIIVTELGVSGSNRYQAEWLERVPNVVARLPLIVALSYFNDVNAPNNRLGTQPDWQVAPATFAEVSRALPTTPRSLPRWTRPTAPAG
jgi:beta-mannanase